VPGETLPEHTDEDGSTRTAAHLHMNGLEVFNFTLREEPAAVRELLAFAGKTPEETDAFVFHQANAFILQNLAKRLKLPAEKVPLGTAGRYGNQSSASIPAALCDELGKPLETKCLRVLCSGFGVGLSWASCWLEIGPLACARIFVFTPTTQL
jgi:3-oxoacyl-[acyl-carrier-protein] synthase-3